MLLMVDETLQRHFINITFITKLCIISFSNIYKNIEYYNESQPEIKELFTFCNTRFFFYVFFAEMIFKNNP